MEYTEHIMVRKQVISRTDRNTYTGRTNKAIHIQRVKLKYINIYTATHKTCNQNVDISPHNKSHIVMRISCVTLGTKQLRYWPTPKVGTSYERTKSEEVSISNKKSIKKFRQYRTVLTFCAKILHKDKRSLFIH